MPSTASFAVALALASAAEPTVEVESRDSVAVATGSVLIAAPPETVWRVMTDCPRAPRFVPRLEQCRVLSVSADGRSDVREHRVRFAFLGRIRHEFRSEYHRPREIRTVRTGGDLRIADGTWKLEPVGDGTRVSFRATLAVNAPVPGGLVRAGLRRDMAALLQALEREATEPPP